MASDNATVEGKSDKKSKSRRKKKIRRGRHGKAGTKPHVGICNILYASVNGFRSKCDSIKQILGEQDVDVLMLTETKVYKKSAIHFGGYQSFSAVRNKKSGGGLYNGIKHGFCQSLLCNRGENAEFITVRMEGKYNGLRIVLVYGPQEKDTEENRKAFYEDLSVEIERCLLSGDSLLLAGDFNAKLGSRIINCDTHTMSKNGKLPYDLVQKNIICIYLICQKYAVVCLPIHDSAMGSRKFLYLIMFLSHLTYMNKSDQWKLMRKTSLHHGENSERVGNSLITMQ